MGETQLTFERYEIKYLLDAAQYARLRERLESRIVPDEYFSSTVCSVYYDTDDYSLIRHSIDGPVYKEKLRLRSYGVPGPGDTVFVELKKKYNGIVYKRRVGMGAGAAEDYLAGRGGAPEDSQMTHELDWLLSRTHPAPRAYIACDREAYVARDDPQLRITFDSGIRWRESELSLSAGSHGLPLLDGGRVLMETKLHGAAPLWLARMFSELGVFPTGYSKYGSCYTGRLLEKYINGVITCA